MKQLIYLGFILLFATSSLAAQDVPADTSYWKRGGVLSLGFTNTGYSQYWQAGALPSQSIIARLNWFADYAREKHSWQNNLALEYGVLRQGNGGDFLKNVDRIEFNSKYGYRLSKVLLAASQLNFRSQFAEGFEFDENFPNNLDSATLISRFLSPAYLNFGVGLDYQPNEDLSIYYSPLNAKLTIVVDDSLRRRYIPAEITTNAVRFELGSNLTIKYRRQLAENILFQTNANFFMNYLDNFPTVDVNWETLTTAQINKWLAVSFATNLIYDADIKFDILDEAGNVTAQEPRVQFQHILTVGVTYNFLQ